jgi:hypothetical protein
VAERGVILDPEVKLGECYMDGTPIVEQGSIADFRLQDYREVTGKFDRIVSHVRARRRRILRRVLPQMQRRAG